MKYLVLIIVACIGLSRGLAQEALSVGSLAPDFKAVAFSGEKLQLSKITKEKNVVLMFYRGQWCPYCNKQMSELQDSLSFIENRNAVVIAITPEKPSEIDETIKKTNVSFDIIYDKGHKIMDLYKVTFQLSKAQRLAFKAWGIDINKASGNDDYALPVPATYVIHNDGSIKASFFNENYKQRMTVADILKALE